ncbi:uncharacterized protein LACBIDRAFT_325961 [Laccaria bicolor S238N-H82]|uniref:Predicted protein n=1 Tax=Laccaria bicolor (strain S238N-H82 / ATCC MYA-4686) TaxID=486041 RepID=B0D6T7_LACBS|nr:uncharacterized protein LACBIDRAFT_325961 [Laccaria bicolor S238N-H82]EDR09279.1 predicted protein [Laccaria bicolor S238N-H82]|eukprot:XP_001879628.1 predicted protein [Laccaria bicolor S238N-H82]
MAKAKPPTASELYIQRRQSEEEEKYPLSWEYELGELCAPSHSPMSDQRDVFEFDVQVMGSTGAQTEEGSQPKVDARDSWRNRCTRVLEDITRRDADGTTSSSKPSTTSQGTTLTPADPHLRRLQRLQSKHQTGGLRASEVRERLKNFAKNLTSFPSSNLIALCETPSVGRWGGSINITPDFLTRSSLPFSAYSAGTLATSNGWLSSLPMFNAVVLALLQRHRNMGEVTFNNAWSGDEGEGFVSGDSFTSSSLSTAHCLD